MLYPVMKILVRRFALIWRVALGAATALVFTGCVGVLPQPVSATKVESGRKLSAPDVAFIKIGQTTRTEVVAQLGTNYLTLPQQRALTYSWEMKGGGWIWWWCVAAYGSAAGDAGTVPGGWRAYFVAFDDCGVVSATEFRRPATGRSLHEHLDAWVGRLSTPPAITPGLADVPQ